METLKFQQQHANGQAGDFGVQKTMERGQPFYAQKLEAACRVIADTGRGLNEKDFITRGLNDRGNYRNYPVRYLRFYIS